VVGFTWRARAILYQYRMRLSRLRAKSWTELGAVSNSQLNELAAAEPKDRHGPLPQTSAGIGDARVEGAHGFKEWTAVSDNLMP